MKRSEINAIMRDADQFICSHGFRLNRFFKPVGRFPTIVEAVPPLHWLVGDYARR